MKFTHNKIVSLILCGAVLIMSAVTIGSIVAGWSGEELPQEEKPITYGYSSSWLSTFSELVEISDRIILGKVTGFGKAITEREMLITERGYASNEWENGVLYTPTVIEVIEWVKGDKPAKKVTFYQDYGETNERIYIGDKYEPINVGDTVMLFLGDEGRTISHDGLMIVNDEVAAPSMVREVITPEGRSYSSKISVYDYIEMVREEIANPGDLSGIPEFNTPAR